MHFVLPCNIVHVFNIYPILLLDLGLDANMSVVWI